MNDGNRSGIARLPQMKLPAEIIESLSKVIATKFPSHPFAHGIDRSNFENLIFNYLAMSMAFPYLQSGAQLRLLFHYLDANLDIPKDVEVTAVVGAFLFWDETGGHHATLEQGNAGLPQILATQRFHANLLRKDIATILGRSDTDIRPLWSPTTKTYLKELYYGLSSVDPVSRCAQMVAFESHAAEMIEALWQSIGEIFDVDKDSLLYFKTHVGGDDPAEAYHVEMTSNMIREVVAMHDVERFLFEFEKSFRLNADWCRSIKRAPTT